MTDLEMLNSNVLLNLVLLYVFSFSFYMQFALVMYLVAAKSLSKRNSFNVIVYTILAVFGILVCGAVYKGMGLIGPTFILPV